MSCWLRTISSRNSLRLTAQRYAGREGADCHSRCCSLTYSLQQMALLSVWRRAFGEWSHYCRNSLKSRQRCLRMNNADADFNETTPIKGLVSNWKKLWYRFGGVVKHEIEFGIEQVDQSQISTVKVIRSDEGITLKTSPCVFFFFFCVGSKSLTRQK